MWSYNYEPYLAHHGVKGQKWGVRNDKDVTLSKRTARSSQRDLNKTERKMARSAANYLDKANRTHALSTRANILSERKPDKTKRIDSLNDKAEKQLSKAYGYRDQIKKKDKRTLVIILKN